MFVKSWIKIFEKLRFAFQVTSYPFSVVSEFQKSGDILSYILSGDKYETSYDSFLVIAQEVSYFVPTDYHRYFLLSLGSATPLFLLLVHLVKCTSLKCMRIFERKTAPAR